jgi:hypothetical protein
VTINSFLQKKNELISNWSNLQSESLGQDRPTIGMKDVKPASSVRTLEKLCVHKSLSERDIVETCMVLSLTVITSATTEYRK